MLALACNDDKNRVIHQKQFNAGENWPSDFNNALLNGVTFFYKNDKLYGSTIGSGQPNYFYCFDLISGKVLWANEVSEHSSFNPIVLNDIIYYVTYTGQRYAYDTLGNELWQRDFSNQRDVTISLSDITFNPINHNLILTDVIGGFYELNKENGDKVFHTEPSDSAMVVVHKPVFIGNNIYHSNDCYKSYKKLPPLFDYNSIVCQDYYTKKIKWIKPVVARELHSKNGNIFFSSINTLFSLNGETGKLNWKLPLDIGTYGGVLFMNDRILCKSRDGKETGIDYDSGKKIPYLFHKRILEYTLSDNHNNKHQVTITLGTFNSNNRFDDACEVLVKEIDKFDQN
jgi:outer membrane protein assembly factor BamB